MRTRVKFCGITRGEDAAQAAQVGADAIGLVFYPASPRYVAPAQARAVVAFLPPFVAVIGLFVDPTPAEVEAVLAEVPLTALQFHGDEPAEFCERFQRSYIKALRMREGVDVAAWAGDYADAQGLLLDAYQPGVPGGTGGRFDWHRVPAMLPRPVVLAGGLTPDNVAAAIEQVRPYAVDVSGGIEAQPGIKDVAKMAAFMRGVNSVEQG